jgi:hypothetical protein
MYFAVTGEHLCEMIRGSKFRPNFSKLIANEKFVEKNLIEAMTQNDPKKRPKASDLLNHPFFWDDEKTRSFFMAAGAQVRPKSLQEREEHEVLTTLKEKIEMLKNWKGDITKTVPLVLEKLEKFGNASKFGYKEDEFSFVRALQNSVSFVRNPK